ncbi:MAG: hypothetical protein AAED33_04555 [Paracoccaceae bacterium]
MPGVARVERARRAAYHAADASPGPPNALTKLTGDKLFNARLTLHPSIHIVRSRYPIFSIWRFNSTEDKSPIGNARETVLVSRPDSEMCMNNITKGTATFVESLQTDVLGVAIVKAKAAEPNFDLAANMTDLLATGLLIDIN